MSKIRQVVITFPEAVELDRFNERELVEIASRLCRAYEAKHPGLVMWPGGIGSLVTSMPITADDEAAGVPLSFDDEVFHVECSAREDYAWPCAACGQRQDAHKGLSLNPEAGACAFEPLDVRRRRHPALDERPGAVRAADALLLQMAGAVEAGDVKAVNAEHDPVLKRWAEKAAEVRAALRT